MRPAGICAATLLLLLGSGLAPVGAHAQDTLYVYGPGGPLPAMREAAETFGPHNGVARWGWRTSPPAPR